MSRFVQAHLLVSYPPSNLNRGDDGRPKTAKLGDAERLRISSQALKRAFRTSDVFQRRLEGLMGVRTRRVADEAFDILKERGFEDGEAVAAISELFSAYGSFKKNDETGDAGENDGQAPEASGSKKSKKKGKEVSWSAQVKDTTVVVDGWKSAASADADIKDAFLTMGQLVFVSTEERARFRDAASTLVRGEKPVPLQPGGGTTAAVDIAMFGRMVAVTPSGNVEAAVQVAHAVTTHRASIEDDYFTAVDDLTKGTGAGHIGEAGFGAGVFYLYACIDRDLLERNLGGGPAAKETANAAIQAFLEAAATVSPGGKQASYASRARAFYGLVERGSAQPRSLTLSFVNPVRGSDQLSDSIARLREMRDKMTSAYGEMSDASYELDIVGGRGTFADLLACATGG